MITKEEYEEMEISDPVPDQAKHPKDWATWNLAPHTEKEILHRAIHSMFTGDESFCYIYCLGFPGNATPELIDELIYVDSGLFAFGGYCERTRDITVDLATKRRDVFLEVKNLSESRDPVIPEAFKRGCAEALERAKRDKEDRIDKATRYTEELRSDMDRAKRRAEMASDERVANYAAKAAEDLKRRVSSAEERISRMKNSDPRIVVTEKIPWGDVVDSLPKGYLRERLPLIKKTASIETTEALKRRGVLKMP